MSRSRSQRAAAEPFIEEAADDAESPYSGPSKSQRKRDMTALQELGSRLVALPRAKLIQLPLAEKLLDAVLQAQTIKSHEARRRQLQYIGKLMRGADSAAIQAQFNEWDSGSREHAAHFHGLERWRERLLDDDTELTHYIARYPAADVQRLRTLVRSARREAAANQQLNPGQEPQRKHYRALFQEIKTHLESEAPPDPHVPADDSE